MDRSDDDEDEFVVKLRKRVDKLYLQRYSGDASVPYANLSGSWEKKCTFLQLSPEDGTSHLPFTVTVVARTAEDSQWLELEPILAAAPGPSELLKGDIVSNRLIRLQIFPPTDDNGSPASKYIYPGDLIKL